MSDENDDGASVFVQHEVTDVARTEEGKAASEAAAAAAAEGQTGDETNDEASDDDNGSDASNEDTSGEDTGGGVGESDSDDSGEDEDGVGELDGSSSAGSDDVGDETSDAEGGEKPKKKRSPAERIAQVTKNWRDAERASDAKDARIAELESQLTAKTDNATQDDSNLGDAVEMPNPDDFTYGELDQDYTAALVAAHVKAGMDEAKKADEVTRQDEAARDAAAEFKTNYEARVVDGIEAYDDFETVVIEAAENGDFPLSKEMASMVVASPVGHHVVHEIASDLPLAKKIAQMEPLQQAQEFGRLAARHTTTGDGLKPKPNKIPKAKEPPRKRAGGNSAKSFDPVTASFSEFEDKVNKDLATKKRW